MDDTAVITSFFAPCENVRMRRNLELWRRNLHNQGIEPYVIELAFGDKPFVLDDAFMRLRADHAIWAKENLLNILVSQLPKRFTKIVWSDCDVVWHDDDWLQKVSRALDEKKAVQAFERVAELDEHGEVTHRAWSTLSTDRPNGGLHAVHRSGVACAARRELFYRWGLYDRCVLGSGDYVHTILGFMGAKRRKQTEHLFSAEHAYHVRAWASQIHWWAEGRVGAVSTDVRRMWHGEREKRKYAERYQQLGPYDPVADVCYNQVGVIQFVKPEHARYAQQYFIDRDEDNGLDASKDRPTPEFPSATSGPKLSGKEGS